MPDFTYNDAILILEITYIVMVVAAVMLLVVRPLVVILLLRWIPPAGALPSRNGLMVRALVLSPFVISTLGLDSSWALIGAVYEKGTGQTIPIYGVLFLVPAMFVVLLIAKSSIVQLTLLLGLWVDGTFHRIGRVSLIVLLRHALFKVTFFLLHTPARRVSLIVVSLAGILSVLAVRHNIMPWALVTEILDLTREIETVSRQTWLALAEISIILLLFFLIIVLVVRPLLSHLLSALPSWGAKPAPPWERHILLWLLIACLFYGCILLAIH